LFYSAVVYHLTRTKIHTTKKLERLVRKLITTDRTLDYGILGKWNATVFYFDRRKCWLVTNGQTKYNVILPDIKASDLGNIEKIFKTAFHEQLIYHGIITDFKTVDSIIGGLDFLSTDNDRSTIGFQNQRLYELDCWKAGFDNLEDMPILDVINRMNTTPIHIGRNRGMSGYTNSVQEIKRLLMER